MFQVLNLFIAQLPHATYDPINTFTKFKFHLDAQFISNWLLCIQLWNYFVIIVISICIIITIIIFIIIIIINNSIIDIWHF